MREPDNTSERPASKGVSNNMTEGTAKTGDGEKGLLKAREKESNLETRVSMLRTQVLSLSEKNEALENMLASLRLIRTAPGRKVDNDNEQVEEGRGETVSRSGKRWLAFGAAAVFVLGTVGVCLRVLRPERGPDDQRIERELIAARKRVSELQVDLKTQAGAPVEQTALLERMLRAKDEEIQRLRLEVLRMRKEIEDQRSSLSSLTKKKDREITELERAIAWMKEENREEIGEIKLEKNKEIEALQKNIKRLTLTKGVAIPGLIDALNHQDVSTQKIIARTLTELTGKSFGTDQEKWRDWWRRNRLNFIRR